MNELPPHTAWPGIPENIRDSLDSYVTHRIPTGGFLEAVLSNDLSGACSRADSDNRSLLWEIAAWIYNHTPSSCWGSPQRYRDWLSERP